MDLGLNGKIAVVCGGSRGMGKAIAMQLAEEGVHLALIARDGNELKKTQQEIQKRTGVKALLMRYDLSRFKEIPYLISRIKKHFGAIHILINNAGGPPLGSLEEVSDYEWTRAIDQNLRSTIVMTREVIPLMRRQKFGRIVNITSQVVKEPLPGMILSNTTRTGVVAFAKSISHELAPFNITVNTLLPGPIKTERLESLIHRRAQRESRNTNSLLRELAQTIPMKRIGNPDEIASLAVFLSSERASYITGTAIAVDGGITKSLM